MLLLDQSDVTEQGFRIVDCSRTAEQRYGYSRERLLTMRSGQLDRMHQEPAFRELLAKLQPGDPPHAGSSDRVCQDQSVLRVAFHTVAVSRDGRACLLDLDRSRASPVWLKNTGNAAESFALQIMEQADCMFLRSECELRDDKRYWHFEFMQSPLHERLFGPDEDHRSGKLWSLLRCPDESEMLQRFLAAIHQGASRFEQDFRVLQRGSGALCWLHETGVITQLGPNRWQLASVFTDVTHRYEMEASLQDSELRNRLTLENSADGIWEYSTKTGETVYTDQSREMMGYPVEEQPPKVADWGQWLHPEDATATLEALRKHIETDEPFAMTARFRHKAGGWRWIKCRAVTQREAGGKALRTVGSFADITEALRVEQELTQGRKLRAVGELAGGVAHEFNNLLTPLLLNLELMQMEQGHDPETENRLKQMRQAVLQARDLTQRILAFGRHSDSARETLDLAVAVGENADFLRHTFDRRIAVELTVPPVPVWVHLNRTEISQVLLNLCLNARDTLEAKLRAGWPNGQPRLELRVLSAEADEQIVEVRDNGQGMTAEVRERLFEPFFTTKEGGRGTGLGLATTWHLVEVMAGRIEVESVPGEGSCFRVFFPRAAEPREEPVVSARGRARPGVEPPMVEAPARLGPAMDRSILLVEDNAEIRNVLRVALAQQGYRVQIVGNGLDAVEMLRSRGRDFDLLLTDINLPGVSGVEVIRAMQAQGLALPVVVIGGSLNAEVRSELATLAVRGILPKPFMPQDIYRVLAEALQPPQGAEV